jgi:hypothetical protein
MSPMKGGVHRVVIVNREFCRGGSADPCRLIITDDEFVSHESNRAERPRSNSKRGRAGIFPDRWEKPLDLSRWPPFGERSAVQLTVQGDVSDMLIPAPVTRQTLHCFSPRSWLQDYQTALWTLQRSSVVPES